jgi:hypothetical protein
LREKLGECGGLKADLDGTSNLEIRAQHSHRLTKIYHDLIIRSNWTKKPFEIPFLICSSQAWQPQSLGKITK